MNSDKNAERLRKKLIREQMKRLQPNECQKYIRLIIDSSFVHSSIGRELVLLLQSSELKYDVRKLTEKFCIIWERSMGQQTFVSKTSDENQGYVGSSIPTSLSENLQVENQVIRIFTAEDFEHSLQMKALDSTIEHLKSAFPTKRITLILPRLPEKTSNNMHIERETLLTELQVNHQCNILQIKSNSSELLQLLKRFTKAIAEEPYKRNKSEAQNNFKKYILNDNKQCVRVEGINGLGRLWQQHLNRLPLITLDVAEAIRAEYSCPKNIIDDIQEHPDPTTKIANIQIDRGAGVLSTNRRIGNVLSSKLIKLYQTRNPNEPLKNC